MSYIKTDISVVPTGSTEATLLDDFAADAIVQTNSEITSDGHLVLGTLDGTIDLGQLPGSGASTVANLSNDQPVTIDLSKGNYFSYTVDQNTTFALTNAPSVGQVALFTLSLVNGSGFDIEWWDNVSWPNGTAPTLTSGVDIIEFLMMDGVFWRGRLVASYLLPLQDWTTLTSIAGWSDSCKGIAYGNKNFLILGESSGISSGDGVTWTAASVPSPANSMSVEQSGLVFAKGVFVTTGRDFSGNSAAWVSDDLSTWTKTYSKSASQISPTALTFGNKKFVLMIPGNTVCISDNGQTWTTHTVMTLNWKSVAYGNGVFFATTTDVVDGEAFGAYSSDGISWSQVTIPLPFYANVAYGAGKFVWMATNGNFATSTDGIEWTVQTAISPDGIILSLVYDDGYFVAPDFNSDHAFVSSDGLTWSKTTLPSNNAWRRAGYGHSKWLMVADNTIALNAN